MVFIIHKDSEKQEKKGEIISFKNKYLLCIIIITIIIICVSSKPVFTNTGIRLTLVYGL